MKRTKKMSGPVVQFKDISVTALLVPDDVCEILRIDKSTFYQYVKSGNLPAFRLTRGSYSEWRMRRGDLERWIEERAKASRKDLKKARSIAGESPSPVSDGDRDNTNGSHSA
jgi:excisionase family DNA binding protein